MSDYDVVMLDLHMPEFSGVDVIESLDKQEGVSKYNIILFTASSASDQEIDELVKKGAKICLKKPVELDTLLKTIENTIQK